MSDRNLVDVLCRQALALGPRPALRIRKHGLFADLSWRDYHAAALAGAAGLVEAGVRPGDRIGLLAENSIDWLIADLAILAAAAVNVPPHAPLTARQVQFQLADAGVSWAFVSTRAQLDKLLQTWQELPSLRGVIVFGRDAHATHAEGHRGELRTFDSFLQRGRLALPRVAGELERRRTALGPDDLATIMYTSGTTGNPKGVMLTHNNLLSNALACLEVEPHGPGDVVLNWLPLSHIYARTVDHYAASLAGGALLCLAESAETLVRDLEEAQPTHLSAVPRFYEKALTSCARDDPAESDRRLRDVFGPRVEVLMSGGAPLPVPVAQAYKRAGLPLVQGYGLTESSPVISFNTKKSNKIGTVGKALPGVEVRIGPDGEVLTRGPHVMTGYWNNPQATAEALQDDWLHTGDLGELDADGFLRITGRKKELLVLSNGKKVVPSYLEGLLQSDPCIEQAVIAGEGKSFLTALIVPHWDNVRAAVAAQGVSLGPAEEDRPPRAVYALLHERIARALVDVSPAEQVRKFVVLPRPFTVGADELTVSLKLRRNVVLAKYAAQIDALYRDA